MVQIICNLLSHKNERIFSSIVKYVGGIMASTDNRITMKYLENDVLEKLGSILYSSNS